MPSSRSTGQVSGRPAPAQSRVISFVSAGGVRRRMTSSSAEPSLRSVATALAAGFTDPSRVRLARARFRTAVAPPNANQSRTVRPRVNVAIASTGVGFI